MPDVIIRKLVEDDLEAAAGAFGLRSLQNTRREVVSSRNQKTDVASLPDRDIYAHNGIC